MEIPKPVFGLYKFTDDESTHYALDGIMFRRSEDGSPIAVATTGCIMVAVTWDDDDRSGAFEAIVPTEACQQMYAYGEVDGYCVTIDEDPDDPAKCVMSTYGQDTTVSVASTVLEGRFPEYQDKFAPTPAAVVVKLNVAMLSDVLATFADMKIDGIVIAVVNHEKAVMMTGTNADGVSIAVALAPQYKDDGTAPVLGWMPVVAKAKSWPLVWTSLNDEHKNEYLRAEGLAHGPGEKCYWHLYQRLERNQREWYSDSDLVLGPDVPEYWLDRQEAMDAIQKAHDTIMQSRDKGNQDE